MVPLFARNSGCKENAFSIELPVHMNMPRVWLSAERNLRCSLEMAREGDQSRNGKRRRSIRVSNKIKCGVRVDSRSRIACSCFIFSRIKDGLVSEAGSGSEASFALLGY